MLSSAEKRPGVPVVDTVLLVTGPSKPVLTLGTFKSQWPSGEGVVFVVFCDTLRNM